MDKEKIILEESEKERKKQKIGTFLALFICALALVLGFWSAVNRTAKLSAKAGTPKTTAINASQKATVDDKAENDAKAARQVGKAQESVAATNSITEKTDKGDNNSIAESKKEEINPTAEFFSMPVGGDIIKKFSSTELQYCKTYCDWRLHEALDIAAEKGTQVHAAGNGKVADVYEDAMLGNVVEIDHGNGITAYYCGLLKPLVKKGQVIKAGTTIGGVGEVPCESVDSMHLHFAVKVKDKWTDPLSALKIESR